MIIRQAKASEATQIAELINLAMLEITYQFIGKEDRNEANNFIAKFVAHENNQYSYQNIYVLEIDGRILGHLSIYDGASLKQLRQPILDYILHTYAIDYSPADETQAGEMYIDTFAVHPSMQGKGYGEKMLQFAIDKFNRIESKTVGLLVDNDNPNAKRLYERLGFKTIKEVEIFGKKMEHMQYA